ncbi:MAG: SigB/SigF/SigG family RNA polymerase sigma factor [Clostridia bacterium]|nr:SigB/SigF/SigG family RNA polymerase sigma factor [Clostridia bacterium]
MTDNEIILEQELCEENEQQLVERNMGLVVGIAKRFINRGYEMDDLTQIGVVGLIKAIRKFNLDFGVKFSTYAVPLIMGEIKRFIRDDGIIKVSRTHKTNAMKAVCAEQRLSQSLNRAPTISEIASECGLEVSEVIEAMEATAQPDSINKAVSDDDSRELEGKITLNNEEEKIVDRVLIKDSLNILSARERKVIMLRYFSEKTQSSISDIIGVSQVQISRIEKNALLKMKNYIGEGE